MMNEAKRQSVHWRMVLALLGAGCGVAMLAGGDACAQAAAGTDGDWQLRGGLGLLHTGKYLGSRESRWLALPMLDARHKSGFFASGLRGVGFASPLGESMQAWAAVGLDGHQRRRKDNSQFALLPEVKMAPALRLGLEYQQGATQWSVVLNSRLDGKRSEGLQRGASTLDLEALSTVFQGHQWQLSAGARLSLMNSRFAQNFLGVGRHQIAGTTLRPYSAKAGVLSATAVLQAQVQLDPQWSLWARAEYERLPAAVADSPLVQRKSSLTQMLLVSRAF